MVLSMARIMPAFVMLVLAWPAYAPADPVQTQPSSPVSGKAAPKSHSSRKAPATPPPVAVAAPKPPEEVKPPDAKPGDAKPAETKMAAHFASLRAEKVFMRSGPSADYPIQWVFVRRGLPVEILAAFDIWRKIRDSSGAEGWVHQGMLTGRRNVLIAGAIRNLRRDPAADAAIVAQLEPGVVAAVTKCDIQWCEVRAGGYRGWVRHDEIWGLEPDEVIQ